ncbi:general transcription factor II-I repeat domain-containing protein 2-like [Ranitomeya imitator]|uniref:general transcription factor II-I repeat domain-containing protein 2-like n=1 Tax=Ranitomeya imitator TaxID=111125 RepID=UPI0037E98C2F
MAKTKELAKDIRDKIVDQHKTGKVYRMIGFPMAVEYEKHKKKMTPLSKQLPSITGKLEDSNKHYRGSEPIQIMASVNEGPSQKKKRSYSYSFHEEWEEQYLFTHFRDKCICLICQATVSIGKKCNVERHYTTTHKKFDQEYPKGTNLRKIKVEDLKCALTAQQAVFRKPRNKSKAATIASFKVAHILAQRKKPFEDGEIVKDAMLAAADSLFQDFKKNSDIISAIKSLQLSGNTITRRIESMSEDIRHQLKRDLEKCDFISLQFDESLDVVDTAQLNIYIRMVFEDLSVKEDLLAVISLKEKTRGEDIYTAFKTYVQEHNIPLQKLVSITTDGAPAMIGSKIGFVTLCRNDHDFPHFLNYHCIIHQESLCTKVINFQHVMKVVVKIVNSIRARPLQHRLFKSFLEELDSQYKDLLLYTEVRWLSRGKLLERFQSLLPEIIQFLELKDDLCAEISDSQWQADLAFLTDITSKLNDLNRELQGKDKTITEMIGAVNAFTQKLKLCQTQLQKGVFHHFPSLQHLLKENTPFDKNVYLESCEKLNKEFEKRFSEFHCVEAIALFMSNPFMTTDISVISSEIATAFQMDTSQLENEIITLNTDLLLKSRSQEDNFWRLVERCKYPLLKSVSKRLHACFGSTYLCESGFSALKILKSKYRSRLTDEHLDDCMRMALTNYNPDFETLAENMQCQISH